MSQASATPARIRVAVLGPVVVESAAGESVEPGGSTAKALIASLVLARGPLSVRGIADDLWGDNPPRNEKAALQTLVSRVRSVAAEGLIVSTPGGYALGVSPEHCDLAAALRLRDAARESAERGDWQAAEAQASAGLALWRGEPGVDLGESELAERLAAASTALRRELAFARARSRVETGDALGALADLDALAEAAPLDESVELLRLRAIAGNGRRNDAIREFGEFRERMRAELGTDPSGDLVAFNAELLRAPEAQTEPTRVLRVGIRSAPNELIGRDADIEALEHVMAQSRLTTVLGAGGLGKTRLAQELAARAAERMPGVVVVELASVRTGDDVPMALASTLGIREYTGTRLSIADPAVRVDVRGRILGALGERQTLLVMDNCEHLIDAAAEWIADILASTRTVRVLATSRAPLMIAAEQVYQLEPLRSRADTAEPGPAVRLFMDRARAARPSVVLPTDVIERLCERLDGLPLAIELAAARVRTMSVDEIERRIGNRFALLRGGDRAAPERHRTLLAVIDWSWNLLTDSQQRILRRLSHFVDGFSADAAEAVSDPLDDVESDLEGLVNQSLLTAAESATTGRVRYRMLETVREFGDQRLAEAGERERVAARIRSWADAFCRAALVQTYGAGQIETFHRVAEEQDNLVAALRDAVAVDDADSAASVFATLGMHWTLRGAHSEVLGLSPQVLAALRGYEPDADHRDAAMIALGLIGGTSMIADARQGMRAIIRVRKLLEQGPPQNKQLEGMVTLLVTMPDMKAAFETIERLRHDDDPALSSFGNLISAQLAENSGELDSAIAYSALAYEKAEQAQDAWTVGSAAQSLAQLHSERGDVAEAIEWADRARPNMEQLSAGEDLRQLEWVKAINQVTLGRMDEARSVFERLVSLEVDAESFDQTDLRAIGLAGLAEIAAAEGDPAEAERVYALSEQTWGDPPRGFAPWYFGAAAGLLTTSVRAGHVNDPRNIRVARRLRSRLLRDQRVRAGMIDRPITGAALLGLAVWLLAPGRDGSDAAQHEIGLELLAMARALRGRQDFPSLRWSAAVSEVERDHPELALQDACARVDALTPPERDGRVGELVAALRDAVAA